MLVGYLPLSAIVFSQKCNLARNLRNLHWLVTWVGWIHLRFGACLLVDGFHIVTYSLTHGCFIFEILHLRDFGTLEDKNKQCYQLKLIADFSMCRT